MDIDEILAERGARYGEFRDHAFIAQLLKSVMMGEFGTVYEMTKPSGMCYEQAVRVREALRAKWGPANILEADQREALDMNAHKVARILNGDPHYSDSWRDISGYATLVADRLDGKVK